MSTIATSAAAEQIYASDIEVGRRYGVDRNTIWRWVKIKEFPAPVRLVGSTRWIMAEVVEWERRQAEQRERVYERSKAKLRAASKAAKAEARA